jgi:cleavage and polyadenylation specificity factor subunit 2
VLLDRWDSQFKEATLSRLLAVCSDPAAPVDLVLLSFGDLEHCGALPVLVGRLGLKVPVYCTAPTLALGYQTLYEAHECQPSDAASAQALPATASSQAPGGGSSCESSAAATSSTTPRPAGLDGVGFCLDDVDAAFAPMARNSHGARPCGCRALKYNEQLVLKGLDLTVTPVNSGRLLGGCLWRLKWQTDELLYACDMNPLGGEACVNRAALPASSSGPTSGGAASSGGAGGGGPALLITDATNWGRSLKPLSQRLGDLKGLVVDTVRRGGHVLLPTDATGRVLELLLFLDRLWDAEPGLAQVNAHLPPRPRTKGQQDTVICTKPHPPRCSPVMGKP